MTKAIKKNGLLRMLLAALVFIGCELSFQPNDSAQTSDAGNNAVAQPHIVLSNTVSGNNYTAEIYDWNEEIKEDDFNTWTDPLKNATIIGSGAAQSGTSCTIPIQTSNGADFSKEEWAKKAWYLVKVTQKSGALNAEAKYKSVRPFDSEKKIALDWTSMIDLEAKRFTVEYYANGGRFIGDIGSKVEVIPGDKASKYPIPTAVRTGYTFDDWYTDEDGSNKYDLGGGKSEPEVTTPITLWAKWIELDALKSIDEVKKYLTPANFAFGEGEEDNPIPLPVKLGQNTTNDNQWQKLLEALQASELYVDLDLSEWNASLDNSKKFDPWLDTASGEKFVVSLILPTDATSIRDVLTEATSRFDHFTKLKKISGARIKDIGEFAFTGISLEEVNFPAAATTIGANAFKDCVKLTTVNIPNATVIRDMAFFGCVALEKVDFPGVTTESIGDQAFQACTALTTADFKNAEVIGANAFNVCVKLTTIDFSKAKIIGDKAFVGSGLITANFPEVTDIGKEAFQNSVDLEEVTFGANVTYIGSGIFSGTALKEANFPKTTAITTTEIGENVFAGIETLKKVVLSKVEDIPANAFAGCIALAELDIQSAEDIGNNAFDGCIALAELDIRSVEDIGNNAFDGCTALAELDIRKAESIGDEAFARTGLKSLAITMGSAPTIGAGLFAGVVNTGDLFTRKKVEIKIAAGANTQSYTTDWLNDFITYTIGSGTAIPQIGHISLTP